MAQVTRPCVAFIFQNCVNFQFWGHISYPHINEIWHGASVNHSAPYLTPNGSKLSLLLGKNLKITPRVTGIPAYALCTCHW